VSRNLPWKTWSMLLSVVPMESNYIRRRHWKSWQKSE
jgi:hypothetical protein